MRTLALLVGAGAVLLGSRLAAQESKDPTPLEVGAVAPDFTLTAATRAGISKEALRLRDLKGKTVVLAFFFKARTGG